jgi:2'-5' RNA ligase
MPEQNWHVTLVFLGEAAVDDVAGVLRRTALPPATAQVSSRLKVLGRTNLVLPVAGLDRLAHAVRAALDPAQADRRFRGHITMARSRGGRPIKGHTTEHPAWSEASFDVDEAALVASRLTPDGSRYETVARFAVTESC